jgi:hypothetical protein
MLSGDSPGSCTTMWGIDTVLLGQGYRTYHGVVINDYEAMVVR